MIPFAELIRPLRRIGRMFCLLNAYIDESYGPRTLCVGGWLLSDKKWIVLEDAWKRTIEYQRDKSVKAGFPPISRYHASDCSNFKKEFSESKGWNKDRRDRFCKRLLQIIGASKPTGIVMGAARADFVKYFTGNDPKEWQEGLYYLSMLGYLAELEKVMEYWFPNERVSIFYERVKFGGQAEKAFNSLKDGLISTQRKHSADRFVTIAPLDWEHSTALQAADLLAYEGYKRIDGVLNGREDTRRSLQALTGGKANVQIGHMPSKMFAEAVMRIKEQQT